VRSCSHELRNCVCECGIGIDIEDGESVSAILNSSLVENDGDEMHARLL